MKKLKIIAIIALILLISVMFIGNCKKINALSSGFGGYRVTISERDQGQYSYTAIYNLKSNLSSDNFNYVVRTSQDFTYLSANNNQITAYRYNNGQYSNLTNFTMTTGLLQIIIDLDASDLCLIIYELGIDMQQYQGSSPALAGITRTLKARIVLDLAYLDYWQNDSIYIDLLPSSSGLIPGLLLNYSYVSATDTLTDINDWVDYQLENSLLYNRILTIAYNYGVTDGYDDGYNTGVSDGEETGYSEGYGDGYDSGYSYGTTDGYNIGYPQGYDAGYSAGYDDGQEGETAISPVFRIISDIFGTIGTIMAIELVPHVPLGLFILVPLFFSALGLILWIWRRN